MPLAEPAPARKRRKAALPRIDLDTAIAEARDAMKQAAKMLQDAKSTARNERRKKARLLKKAASLNSEDLERIAVLKRCGLWDPKLQRFAPADGDESRGETADGSQSSADPPVASHSSSSSSSTASPAPNAAQEATSPSTPQAPPVDPERSDIEEPGSQGI